MKKETISNEKLNEYLKDEKVKRNLELYNNNKEQFLKEINEIRNGSFTSLIKETLKNIKKNKKHKKK